MCIGTSAGKYPQTTPELNDEHLDGISFNDASSLMPWALYTIAPGTIMSWMAQGSERGDGFGGKDKVELCAAYRCVRSVQ